MDSESPPILNYHTPTPKPRDRLREDRDTTLAVTLFCWVPTIFGLLQSLRDHQQRNRHAAPEDVAVLLLVAIPLALWAAHTWHRTRPTVSRTLRRLLLATLTTLILVATLRLIELR